jgi:hypothetical protein
MALRSRRGKRAAIEIIASAIIEVAACFGYTRPTSRPRPATKTSDLTLRAEFHDGPRLIAIDLADRITTSI